MMHDTKLDELDTLLERLSVLTSDTESSMGTQVLERARELLEQARSTHELEEREALLSKALMESIIAAQQLRLEAGDTCY